MRCRHLRLSATLKTAISAISIFILLYGSHHILHNGFIIADINCLHLDFAVDIAQSVVIFGEVHCIIITNDIVPFSTPAC